jgi:hypothetical protein
MYNLSNLMSNNLDLQDICIYFVKTIRIKIVSNGKMQHDIWFKWFEFNNKNTWKTHAYSIITILMMAYNVKFILLFSFYFIQIHLWPFKVCVIEYWIASMCLVFFSIQPFDCCVMIAKSFGMFTTLVWKPMYFMKGYFYGVNFQNTLKLHRY